MWACFLRKDFQGTGLVVSVYRRGGGGGYTGKTKGSNGSLESSAIPDMGDGICLRVVGSAALGVALTTYPRINKRDIMFIWLSAAFILF